MLKVGSMFAGIGGTCLGFIQNNTRIVWSNELDKHACETYRHNFGDDVLEEADITKVDKTKIPKIDILIAGFPCQAFSIAGYRRGFKDKRGNIFFEIIEVIDAQRKSYNEYPEVIVLENVKNLKSHDKGKTYKTIKNALEFHGYYVKSKILNSMEYGNVPQNRERIYIVAFQNKENAQKFKFPEPIPLTNKLNHVIDRDSTVDKVFYYTNESKYYPMLKNEITSLETVYQIRRVYIRENKSNVCPTLTANMGTGGHNVPLILDNKKRIRKLTPNECLKLQGFPKGFDFPKGMANSHKYKQIGNSVTVPVIRRIANNILSTLKENSLEKSNHQ